MSTTSRSGRSSRSRRTGAGWNSSAAWFPSHASVAASLHTVYATSRLALGAGIVTVRIHDGACFGVSFWKYRWPSTPSGARITVSGRSRSQGSMRSATEPR